MASPTDNSRDAETEPLLRRDESSDEPTSSAWDNLEALLTTHTRAWTPFLLASILVLVLACSALLGLTIGLKGQIDRPVGKPRPSATITSTAPSPTITTDPAQLICLTPQCVTVAATVLNSLDTNRDPCRDFYEFATGGWKAYHHPQPALTILEDVKSTNDRVVSDIIRSTSHSNDEADARVLKKLKDFDLSCRNVSKLTDLGLQPIWSIIREIHRIFPERPTHTTRSYRLASTIAYLHSLGIPTLFESRIDRNPGEDAVQLPWLVPPNEGIVSKDLKHNSTLTEEYRKVLESILYQFDQHPKSNDHSAWPPWPWPPWGGRPTPEDRASRARRLSKAVLDLDMSIMAARIDYDNSQDPLHIISTVAINEFSKIFPALDYRRYVSEFAPPKLPPTVVLEQQQYFVKLNDIISSESEILMAYFISRVVFYLSPFLDPNSQLLRYHKDSQKIVRGLPDGPEVNRDHWCASQTVDGLGYAVGRFFMMMRFSDETKYRGEELADTILQALKHNLQESRWMSSDSKNTAADKVEHMVINLGYPRSSALNISDSTGVEAYYSDITIQPDQFFNNIVRVRRSLVFRQWRTLGDRGIATVWETKPTDVRPFSRLNANKVMFPAGLLQSPVFDPHQPKYVNYGLFGSILASELSRSFVQVGRYFSATGQLRSWWDNGTTTNFEEIQRCFQNQQSAASRNGIGKAFQTNNQTLDISLSDASLTNAYRAWKKQYAHSLEKDGEMLLPGLGEFSRDQVFFIAFALRFANRSMTNAELGTATTGRDDIQISLKSRVEGAVMNIPEFAAAFQCPKGSKLNPPRDSRCRLW